MVSRRGKSKACVAAFAERKAQLYLAVRTAASMEKAVGWIADRFPQDTFQISTLDRGNGFPAMQQLDITLQTLTPHGHEESTKMLTDCYGNFPQGNRFRYGF
ncbi:hypothetical protein SAMN05444972_101386 [Marininema halotolerans]|uniref:Uncharacterized protein n=1 Tax=Marininema halotolerans TaxID=1155944 RepID=A0A1I6P661_9BACL|nr:hypothetical protein SAMN05444972_101386 [Marininema halotolerans]